MTGQQTQHPAAATITAALRQRGYYAVGSQCTRRRGGQTIFTLWSNGVNQLLMEVFEDGDGGRLCELYQPLDTTNSVDATIAAIP